MQLERSEADIEQMLRDVLVDHGTKEAAGIVAKDTGLAKKELYNLALRISKDG